MHRQVSTEAAGPASARPHLTIWPGGSLVTYVVIILDVMAWTVATWAATTSVRRPARLAGRLTWAITASRLCHLGFTAATGLLLLPAAFGELSKVMPGPVTGWPHLLEDLVPVHVAWLTAMSLAPAGPALLGFGFISLRQTESVQLAVLQWTAAGWLLPLFLWTLSLVARRDSVDAPEVVVYLLAAALVFTVVSVMHAATWRIAWSSGSRRAH